MEPSRICRETPSSAAHIGKKNIFCHTNRCVESRPIVTCSKNHSVAAEDMYQKVTGLNIRSNTAVMAVCRASLVILC